MNGRVLLDFVARRRLPDFGTADGVPPGFAKKRNSDIASRRALEPGAGVVRRRQVATQFVASSCSCPS